MFTVNVSEEHIAMVETKRCYECKHIHEMNWKGKSTCYKCDIDNCLVKYGERACLCFEAGGN